MAGASRSLVGLPLLVGVPRRARRVLPRVEVQCVHHPLGRSGGTTRSSVADGESCSPSRPGVKPHPCGRANSGPNPTAHLAGVGEGLSVRTFTVSRLPRSALPRPTIGPGPPRWRSCSWRRSSSSPRPPLRRRLSSGRRQLSHDVPDVTTAKQVAATSSKVTTADPKRSGASAVTAARPSGAKKAMHSEEEESDLRRDPRDGAQVRRQLLPPWRLDAGRLRLLRLHPLRLRQAWPARCRTTRAAQYTMVHHVSRANARPGDLIFFRSSSGTSTTSASSRSTASSTTRASTASVPVLGIIFSSNVTFGRV